MQRDPSATCWPWRRVLEPGDGAEMDTQGQSWRTQVAPEAMRRELISVGRRHAAPRGQVQWSWDEERHCCLHSVPRSAVTESLLRLTSWPLGPGAPRGVEDEEGPWWRHCSSLPPPPRPWWDLWLGWLCVVLPQTHWPPLLGALWQGKACLCPLNSEGGEDLWVPPAPRPFLAISDGLS